jgi:hypothetical protein
MKDKLFFILVALLGLTIISWLSLNHLNLSTETLGSFVLILAFLKLRLIVVHFMELPKTSKALRFIFESWIVLVAGITLALYLS